MGAAQADGHLGMRAQVHHRLTADLEMASAERAQLDKEHVFDALVAAMTARAVALDAMDRPLPEQLDLAAEEGWVHVASPGHKISELTHLVKPEG
jgi:hypothetical protein